MFSFARCIQGKPALHKQAQTTTYMQPLICNNNSTPLPAVHTFCGYQPCLIRFARISCPWSFKTMWVTFPFVSL